MGLIKFQIMQGGWSLVENRRKAQVHSTLSVQVFSAGRSCSDYYVLLTLEIKGWVGAWTLLFEVEECCAHCMLKGVNPMKSINRGSFDALRETFSYSLGDDAYYSKPPFH